MADALREQAWRFICATFPERQIYIRSDGRVQFFTFGPMMQAILAGISLLFLGWVAFTSVNTIFKDRIIATKENHYRQMQSSYENRIADLQQSYDQLNGALLTAEDRFERVAKDLEAKHETLAGLIHHKEALRQALGLPKDQAHKVAASTLGLPAIGNVTADASDDEDDGEVAGATDVGVPDAASALAPASAGGQGGPETAPPVPEPAPDDIQGLNIPGLHVPGTSTVSHTFLKDAAERLGALFHGPARSVVVNHPALRHIAQLRQDLTKLYPVQQALLKAATTDIEDETHHLDKTLKTAGLNPKAFIAKVDNARGGIGGPDIPIPQPKAGTPPTFSQEAVVAMASLEDLEDVTRALRSVPLVRPVTGDAFYISSPFGPRHDPFTGHLAFHPGMDFAGPWGSPVHVTAPGVVVFAGRKGGYGNAVEVDHGFGIKTRYGHLSKILVKVGEKLKRGDVVGKLGSTGRSTGPHVHYEVWYDNKLRNPSKFLKAGRYVLQE